MRSAFSPARLYGALALAEAVTWALLLIGMFLKYGPQVTELGVRIGGGLHGFVFLAFVVTTVVVAIDQRWRAGELLLGLASAIVPFATIPAERWLLRRGKVGEQWRLREEPARTAPEKLVSLAVRRPVPSAVVAVALVAVVFSAMLVVGPPGS